MNMSNLRVFLSTVNNAEFACFPSCSQVAHLCLCYEENLLNFKEIVFRYTHGLGSLLNCNCPFFNFWLPDNSQSKRINEWRVFFLPRLRFKCRLNNKYIEGYLKFQETIHYGKERSNVMAIFPIPKFSALQN